MINDILELIKDTYGPLTYNSVHTLVKQWPPEVVGRLNYETVVRIAHYIAYVVGEA